MASLVFVLALGVTLLIPASYATALVPAGTADEPLLLTEFGQCGGLAASCGRKDRKVKIDYSKVKCQDECYEETACPLGTACIRQTKYYWQCLDISDDAYGLGAESYNLTTDSCGSRARLYAKMAAGTPTAVADTTTTAAATDTEASTDIPEVSIVPKTVTPTKTTPTVGAVPTEPADVPFKPVTTTTDSAVLKLTPPATGTIITYISTPAPEEEPAAAPYSLTFKPGTAGTSPVVAAPDTAPAAAGAPAEGGSLSVAGAALKSIPLYGQCGGEKNCPAEATVACIDDCWAGYSCEDDLICLRQTASFYQCGQKGWIGRGGTPRQKSECKADQV